MRSNDMIERVARLLARSDARFSIDTKTASEEAVQEYEDCCWTSAIEEAVSILEAMREPTIVMKAAGQWFQFESPYACPPVDTCVAAGINAARIWQEMIDAALRENPAD